MEAVTIVPEFVIADHVSSCLFSRGIGGAVDSLVLQCREERLSEGVIVANAGSTHGVAQAELGDGVGELVRGVVAAAVGVEDRVRGELDGRPHAQADSMSGVL